MAYWNHFLEKKYKQIKFSDISIGDKFRCDFFKNKKRRKDIICIKTGNLTYIELKNKKEHKLIFDNAIVSSFDELTTKNIQL